MVILIEYSYDLHCLPIGLYPLPVFRAVQGGEAQEACAPVKADPVDLMPKTLITMTARKPLSLTHD
jgi:hypothetical protein